MRSNLELFVQSVNRQLGSPAAILGGLGRIVFTPGIGEIGVRVHVCRDAAWHGLELD